MNVLSRPVKKRFAATPASLCADGARTADGFTLVEIVVVLAIVAILALMALPGVSDSTLRAQIKDALPLADVARKPIDDAWKTTQTLPSGNAAAGLPVPEKIVSHTIKSVTIENGAIHIVFGYRANAALKGKTLSLRPAVVEDARIVPIAWVCGNALAPTPMTIRGKNRTDVPDRYLPFNCRKPG